MILGFIGAGNMVQAMARGWAAAADGPDSMLFTDAGSGRAREIADEVGGEALSSNAELASRAEILVLGCKPADLDRVAHGAQGSPVVVSLLGAAAVERVAAAFPAADVYRVMPNLGVERRRGVLCFAAAADEGRAAVSKAEVERLLGRLGAVYELEDDLIDAATAVMGCSPAYLDLLVDAIAGAGAAAGLSEPLAREMAIEAFAGTTEVLKSRGRGELREAVASPGGSTEAGLAALEEAGFADIAAEAVRASLIRMGAATDRSPGAGSGGSSRTGSAGAPEHGEPRAAQ